MKIEELNLNSVDKNSLLERLKDLKVSSPSTMHPIDLELEKLGFVSIKGGVTTFLGIN